MNRVILKGHLTADPEIRYTPAGQAVAEFTIAVNEDYKDKEGKMVKKAHFLGCVCWGARGEAYAKYHKKGSETLVEGKLTQERWEDKTTGKQQSKTRVTVEQWEFVGGKAQGDAPAAQPRPARAANVPAPSTTPKPAAAVAPAEDDVPF